MKKRIFPFLMIVFFSFNVAVVRPAQAILPVVAVIGGFFYGGSTAAHVGTASLVIGAVLTGLLLTDKNVTSPTKENSMGDIPLGIRDRTQRDTPVGWTGPINPPATLSKGFQALANTPSTCPSSTGKGATQALACADLLTNTPHCLLTTPANWYTKIVGHTIYNGFCYAVRGEFTDTGVRTTTPTASYQTTETATCPTGYTYSGGTCTLSNESAVALPADGRCQVLASISGFTIDPQDAECSGLSGNKTTITPTKAEVTNTDGSKISITINPDGSRTYNNSVANVTNNTTTTTIINLTPASIGSSASITGTSTVTTAGTGTLATSTPVAGSIEFPTDYNRELTQTQIKDELVAATAATSSADLGAVQAASLAEKNAEAVALFDSVPSDLSTFQNTLGWPTWIPTFPSTSCSPLSGSILGKTITWDICPKMALLNETIGWLLAMLTAWGITAVFFRR